MLPGPGAALSICRLTFPETALIAVPAAMVISAGPARPGTSELSLASTRIFPPPLAVTLAPRVTLRPAARSMALPAPEDVSVAPDSVMRSLIAVIRICGEAIALRAVMDPPLAWRLTDDDALICETSRSPDTVVTDTLPPVMVPARSAAAPWTLTALVPALIVALELPLIALAVPVIDTPAPALSARSVMAPASAALVLSTVSETAPVPALMELPVFIRIAPGPGSRFAAMAVESLATTLMLPSVVTMALFKMTLRPAWSVSVPALKLRPVFSEMSLLTCSVRFAFVLVSSAAMSAALKVLSPAGLSLNNWSPVSGSMVLAMPEPVTRCIRPAPARPDRVASGLSTR